MAAITPNGQLARTIKDPTYPSSPTSLEPAVLEYASPMSLALRPSTAEAESFMDEVFVKVREWEQAGRKRQRGIRGERQLRDALASLTGSILRRWRWPKPKPVSRSLMSRNFTQSGISADAFKVAWKGMVALGLLHTKGGMPFIIGRDWNYFFWGGRRARFWPTDELLSLADSHGLAADRIEDAFRPVALERVPKVQEPVILRKAREKKVYGTPHRQRRSGANLPIDREDPQVQAVEQAVRDQNTFAARFMVSNVTPPRWYRIFNRTWRLGGRWYAAGHDEGSAYLYLPEQERLRTILINGDPVVEVDVKASHLTILHGLLGLPLPEGDLYMVHPGIPRPVAKAWLTTNLGKGKAGARWSGSVEKELRTVKAKVVRDAMVAAYPFLEDLLQIVPADLREEEGDDTDLVPLYLQAIEAAALTDAIAYARSKGVLALPTHDGLIVPQSAEQWAIEGLTMGYQKWAKITPRTDVERGGS